MRIALYNLTTTTRYGGVESFVWDLARELAARGHAVDLFGGVGARREPLPPQVRVLTFPFISRRWVQAVPPLRRAYAEAKLAERLSMALSALPQLVRGGYHVIHLQKPYDMAPALLARRLGGAKVLLGSHGEDFYRGDRWLAAQIDGAVACSQFNAETVARRYPLRPDVIYNGVDLALFSPQLPEPGLRTRLALPAHAPLLLFVGRLQPWKGLETGLRALAEPALQSAYLLVAGDGEDRLRLERIANDLGVAARVRWLGSLERTALPRLIASCDLLIATSHASETFGIGLVEAQGCGLPVVASRFGGFPEVIDEGHTGLLYPPRDAKALALAAASLLEDPARRAAFAAAAPAWASQFSWQAVGDRVEAAYRRLVPEAF